MLEKDSDYIPLLDAGSEHLHFLAKSFPEWVPLNKLSLNIKRLKTMCRIGGISDLVIGATDTGETSSFVPMISGFNSQGEATAAKGGLKTKVPTHEQLGLKPPQLRFHEGRWTLGAVILNSNEIANQIRFNDKFSGNIRSEEAWAYFIDKSIKEGVEKVGVNHLTSGFSALEKAFSAMYYAVPLTAALMLKDIPTNILLVNYLYNYSLMRIITNLHIFLRNHFNPQEFGIRQSFFDGPELDRALILKAVSKTSTLVKPTN